MVYGEDLAYIHDVGFASFVQAAAPWLLRSLNERGVGRGQVVDLGCGSGVWASELVRAGYEATGIDISRAMIALARKREPRGRFFQGSFFDSELPPCDAVTSLGECFSYKSDEKAGEAVLPGLLARIYAALRPGGVLIFDVLEKEEVRTHHSRGPDWAVLADVEVNPETREVVRRVTSFRKVGGLYRREDEVHCLALYKGSDLAREMRKLGFRVRKLGGYGSLRFRPGQIGFLARKM